MFKKLIIREHPNSHITLEEICGVTTISLRDGKVSHGCAFSDGKLSHDCVGRVELKKTEVKQLIKNLVDILGTM
jgi:hypothetical protein